MAIAWNRRRRSANATGPQVVMLSQVQNLADYLLRECGRWSQRPYDVVGIPRFGVAIAPQYPQPRPQAVRGAPMGWTVKLVAEVEPGQMTEYDVAAFERGERIAPAALGLSLAESKALLAATQAQVVVAQVARHNQLAGACLRCGRAQSSKGY